jgi:O-antigen/teichoic acid export membrane protein
MATQTKKITVDTIALFVGRVAGLLLSVARLNYLATYLGVANFGVLNFSVYFTSLFQFLFDLGLAQLLTRELARNPGRSNSLLGTALLLKLAVALVAGSLVAVAILVSQALLPGQFDAATNWAVGFTTVALAINGMSMLFLSAFQAHRKMILVSAASIVNDVILSAAIIVLLPQFPLLTTVLVLTIVAACVNLSFLVITYRRVIGRPSLHIDREAWRLLVREGTPIAFGSLGISVYTYMGPTVLQYTRGKVEVGIYGAGYKIISILTLLPTVLTQVLFPIFSDFAEHARHKLDKALNDSLRVTFLVSLPLAVGTIMVASKMIGFIYPPEYHDTTIVLQLVIAGNALGYLGWILYTFLIATGRQKYCMWNSLVVGIAVLSSNLFLVPRYGFRVVAVIQMLTDIVLFTSMAVYVVGQGYPLRETRTAWKIVLASLTMGVGLSLIPTVPLLPSIAAGIVVYAIMILLLRGFGDQEREVMRKLLQRLE